MNRLIHALLLGLLVCTIGHAESKDRARLPLNVMTFNLLHASDRPPHAWATRRPLVAATIRGAAPDIIGTQEVLHRQIRDLETDLPNYDWIGQGRQGGSKDEYSAIFYRRDRFTPLAYDHFWLSDTPDRVGSITWGHRWVRMATWVHFKDLRTQREFIVLNTHWDHQVATAREKSAMLIRERIAQFNPAIPLIVMGDFNCPAGECTPFTTLTTDTGLIDTWTAAEHRTPLPAPNTFHGFQPPVFEAKRIDWILARQPTTVTSAHILVAPNDSRQPSDHYPVTAKITFD